MRLFDITVKVRLDADERPALSVDVDVEDGVPQDFVTGLAPGFLRKVADTLEHQAAEGSLKITERGA